MRKIRMIFVTLNIFGVFLFCTLGLFIGVQQVGVGFSLYHDLNDSGIINQEAAFAKKYNVQKKIERACTPSGLGWLIQAGVAFCLSNAVVICLLGRNLPPAAPAPEP